MADTWTFKVHDVFTIFSLLVGGLGLAVTVWDVRPPAGQVNVTYKKAQAAKLTAGDQLDLVAEGGPDEAYGEPDSKPTHYPHG